MEKAEHASRLRAAMARRGLDRQAVADVVGVGVRTVTNWTTGKTMPPPVEREALRQLLPAYDTPGDAVEIAIMGADQLTEDRRHMLLGTYKRLLREQADEGRPLGA